LHLGCQVLNGQGAVMKKLLLAGVAGIALAVGAPANAADLGPRPAW
jgi:hypothetical protein